jgi:hypothetical protein
MAAALNLQMSVKMLYAADNPFALFHAGAGPQCDRISLFAGRDRFMRLMGVAPRGASVNEGLELPGNICPIGRRYRDDDVRPGILIHQCIHVVMLNTFCRLVAASAALTVSEMIIIDAYDFCFISG